MANLNKLSPFPKLTSPRMKTRTPKIPKPRSVPEVIRDDYPGLSNSRPRTSSEGGLFRQTFEIPSAKRINVPALQPKGHPLQKSLPLERRVPRQEDIIIELVPSVFRELAPYLAGMVLGTAMFAGILGNTVRYCFLNGRQTNDFGVINYRSVSESEGFFSGKYTKVTSKDYADGPIKRQKGFIIEKGEDPLFGSKLNDQRVQYTGIIKKGVFHTEDIQYGFLGKTLKREKDFASHRETFEKADTEGRKALRKLMPKAFKD